ncbi:MAG: glycosyltransferase family 4 protein, partial [Actinobacteria bacterium]|nr:glycosyltransferase family 4 protein [Actinomycetota bacterium]
YFEPFFLALPIYKKYKTVVTVHDLTPIVFPNAFPKGIKGQLKWQMQKFSLKKANAIITDSESSKKDILKYVGVRQNKVKVVYLAAGEQFKKLEKGSWEKELIKKYDLPQKFVLYVGDVTWNKNLPRFLDAVTELEIPIVMVGKSLVSEDYDKNNPWNNDLNRVNEFAKKNDKILRLGFVSNEELVGLYNLATVFTMPSLYEGFGLPVLEAMACGCPVITSKEGSLEEVSGKAAHFVDAYDVESIKFGIDKVFKNDKLREELVQKGFENIKRFSWKNTAQETLNVYKEVSGK